MNNSSEINSIDEEEASLTSVGDEQTRKKSGTGLLVKVVFFTILLALLGMLFFFVSSITGSDDDVNNAPPNLTKKVSTNTLPERNFVLPSSPESNVEPIPLQQRERLQRLQEVDAEKKAVVVVDKTKSKLSVMRISKESTNSNNNTTPPRSQREELEGSELSKSLAPTVVYQASAAKLKDRNFILAKGAFINCVLKTRLDSSVAGMSSCIVTRDIYSDNGKVVLIEKGAEVTGEYSSSLNRGVSRIFVLWNRIKTPLGVVINIDSPASDSLGGSGLPGFLDTHFWQRFGGALLLSLVDDIASNLAANTENGTINSTSENSSYGAEIALENSIDIPSTLHINHGAKVGIYVARDLDFSSVYYVK